MNHDPFMWVRKKESQEGETSNQIPQPHIRGEITVIIKAILPLGDRIPIIVTKFITSCLKIRIWVMARLQAMPK